MNTPNNQRKQATQEKIKKLFIELIQSKEINQISVSNICKLAKINRTTFYNNYLDVYDLADNIKKEMFNNMFVLYKDEAIQQKHSYDYLKLFRHIKDNQFYYNTIFRLNFDFSEYFNTYLEDAEAIKFYGTTDFMEYHIEFFKAGISAIIKKWLLNGCKESPEDMANILRTEYQKKNTI